MQGVDLPNSPAGMQLAWFFSLCADGWSESVARQVEDRFTAAFLSRVSSRRVGQIVSQFGKLLDDAELLRVEASSATSVVVGVRAGRRRWRATCAVQAEPPHRISNLHFQDLAAVVGSTGARTGDAFAAALELVTMRPTDPYPLYERIRAGGQVLSTSPGVAVVTGYDAADWLLKSEAFGQDAEADAAATRADWREHPALTATTRSMLFMNPPDHTRVRRVAAGAFTPRVVADLRPRVEQLVDELVTDMIDRGEVDFMTSFAQRLPVAVVSELVGVPNDDVDLLLGWSRALITSASLSDEALATADEAAIEFTEYFGRLVADRRRQRKNDLASALVAASEGGEHLSSAELVENLLLLYVAGFITTVHLLGNGVAALLGHVDQAETLKRQPELARAAVDEVLRYDTPLQVTQRRALQTTTVAGVTIDAGHRVFLLLGAANRDPNRFADPDRFDITRQDTRPLSFGAGIHFCLGAALARLEGEIAFTRLFGGDLAVVAAAEPTPLSLPQLRGLEHLPVTVAPSTRRR